jgi:hypothetical protein
MYFLVVSVGDSDSVVCAGAGHDIKLADSTQFPEHSDIQSGI